MEVAESARQHKHNERSQDFLEPKGGVTDKEYGIGAHVGTKSLYFEDLLMGMIGLSTKIPRYLLPECDLIFPNIQTTWADYIKICA